MDLIAETLHKDFFAEQVLPYTDPKMGELTMNAGVFFSKESEDNTIALNFRYPQRGYLDAIKADL